MLAIPITLFLIAACSTNEDESVTAPPATDVENVQPEGIPCPVISSSDWRAWLDRMPGAPSLSLNIMGKIELPTPGFKVEWSVGALDRRNPPAQHLLLKVTPPTGMVAQVLVSDELSWTTDALASNYRAIHIHCGDKTLATITEIPTVH